MRNKSAGRTVASLFKAPRIYFTGALTITFCVVKRDTTLPLLCTPNMMTRKATEGRENLTLPQSAKSKKALLLNILLDNIPQCGILHGC